jgi:hypothetical protein
MHLRSMVPVPLLGQPARQVVIITGSYSSSSFFLPKLKMFFSALQKQTPSVSN